MNQLTIMQILEETVKFYDDDPTRRSLLGPGEDQYNCVYASEDGQNCAIGRCLTEEALEQDPDSHTDSSVSGVWYDMTSLDKSLRPQYRGHTMRFWERIQHLHDTPNYWDMKGLTNMGHVAFAEMMLKFMA